MKIIIKIVYSILIYTFFLNNAFWEIKIDMLPTSTIVDVGEVKDWNYILFLLEYVRDSIFGLLALIGIAAFLFIGIRLVMAKWNPEEFKKAIMHFIYAIVWIVVVTLSWVAVSLVSSLNF